MRRSWGGLYSITYSFIRSTCLDAGCLATRIRTLETYSTKLVQLDLTRRFLPRRDGGERTEERESGADVSECVVFGMQVAL